MLSHPLSNEKSYLSLIYYLLNKQVNTKARTSILVLVDSVERKDFLLGLAAYMLKMFFEYSENNKLDNLGTLYNSKCTGNQIIIMTFR